jgi:transposase
LILDNLKVHHSNIVKKWVKKNERTIELFFLPSYSPEKNPDEYLNNDVKSNAVGRRRPATRGEMKRNISSYLRSTQKQPAIVKSYFRAKPVRYAA